MLNMVKDQHLIYDFSDLLLCGILPPQSRAVRQGPAVWRQGEDSALQTRDASPHLAWVYFIFNYSHQTAGRKRREGEGRRRGMCQLLSASAEARVLILLLFLIKLFYHSTAGSLALKRCNFTTDITVSFWETSKDKSPTFS